MNKTVREASKIGPCAALNERNIRSARGTRWYASSVGNLLSRANKLAEVL